MNIATLVKLLKGKNNRKAIQVVIWYFLSSLGYIIAYFVTLKNVSQGSSVGEVWLWLPAICGAIFYCFESVGHFQFTFNYLKVVMMIPYVIENKKMPKIKKVCLLVYSYAWKIGNLSCGVLYAKFAFESEEKQINKNPGDL